MATAIHVALPDGHADRLGRCQYRLRNLWRFLGQPQRYAEELSEIDDELERLKRWGQR